MEQIDVVLLKRAFLSAAQNLEAKKDWINELNVFPVPDGDTGTNMTMTILEAAKAVAAADNDMTAVARFIARSKGKFGCNFVTAFAWLYQGHSGCKAN